MMTLSFNDAGISFVPDAVKDVRLVSADEPVQPCGITGSWSGIITGSGNMIMD